MNFLQFWKNKGYAKAKKPDKNDRFRCLEKNRSFTSWSGVLPQTPLCTHFLYCISTEHSDSDGVLPEKQFPEATHEIRLGYRLNLGNRPLSFLYVAQYDFNHEDRSVDYVADKITLAIALELVKSKNMRLLLRPDPEYWDWFISYQFRYAL